MKQGTTPRTAANSYRPDIDGLRAIAVLSVVIYHLNKSWLPGGYVGVDIFFVISGFLITRIIWSELQENRFSLVEFYMRRIRRIAPAFFAMTVTTLVAGVFLFLPEDLMRLAKSAVWASVSAANIYFWRHLDTGYFADSSEEEPMLHTWSLGVEEQFYLLWPALLMLIAAMPRRRAVVVTLATAICIGSFIYGESINSTNMKFAYFMLPARIGELMTGAILALLPRLSPNPDFRWSTLTTASSLLGFGLLAFSLFWLNDSSPFPGINALYPCLGAALVIVAGERSALVSRVLGLGPMVYIGLISYSLYLWHWPILAFVRYFFGDITPALATIAFVTMLAMATLSYRFVEQPARHAKLPRWKQATLLFGAPALCVAAFGAYASATGGMKQWIEASSAYPQLARLNEDTAPAYSYPYICQLSRHDPTILEQPRCVTGSSDNVTAPRVLLWGDSHAAHYVGVASVIAKAADITIRNAAHDACPPLMGGTYGFGIYREGCSQFRPYVAGRIERQNFDLVLMGGNWSVYDKAPGFRSDLERTIQLITARGVRIALLAEAPKFLEYNRECDMRWSRIGLSGCNELTTADTDSEVNRYLHNLASKNDKVSFLNIRAAICTSGQCRPYLQGHPIYFDPSHLSMSGSWRIGETLIRTPASAEWKAAMFGQHVISPLATATASGNVQASDVAAFKSATLAMQNGAP